MKNVKQCRAAAFISALLTALLLSACAADRGESPPETAEPTREVRNYSGMLRISELMIKNRATLLSPDGRFSDWVELENVSGEAVPLEGWQLSDGGKGWELPPLTLEPGERLLVFCDKNGQDELCADFSLSAGEQLSLVAPSGETADSVLCADIKGDHVMVRAEDGSFQDSRWASPGEADTPQGCAAFAAGRQTRSPIVINEAAVSSGSSPRFGQEPCDWVELRNVSDAPQELSDYWLSDELDELMQWQLPQRSLEPGECVLVFCTGDEPDSADSSYHAPFSLNAQDERLYLSRADGSIADYVYLHDIPIDGSMGRLDDEDGFFYFERSSPGEVNQNGRRLVSNPPETLTPDGCFEGVGSMTVELSARGDIYYTTDGAAPTTDSALYTGPIELSGTCVIRAISVEEGALPSRISTYSYIINEGHSLPVLSLAVDDPAAFRTMYNNSRKGLDLSANIALYDGESSFNQGCAVSMKGWTSLNLPKKSLGVSFKGVYGGKLRCDVFQNGITEYSSLSVRAGQDYPFSIFRNELLQRLCSESSDAALTQESKYCVLYINGEYRGIYCLKEDFSKQYYASHAGVSPESVTAIRTPVPLSSDFYREVLDLCWKNDMSVDENYRQLCQRVDVESLIDWFILEGYSANTDVQGNVRVFRSTENGGKWSFAFYDLDWGFCYSGSDFSVLLLDGVGNAGNQMPTLVRAMLRNSDFRARVLERFAELNKTVLSNDHVLALIDEYQILLEPEAARDRERWDLGIDSWYSHVDGLRSFITDNNWEVHNIDQLCRFLDVTPEEREAYFGR